MKKNIIEQGLIRISLGAQSMHADRPAYLKPGQSMSFETGGFYLSGEIRLLRLGGHPNLEFVSASTNGGKDQITKKELEEGYPVVVMQKLMITVKNKDEGRLLWAHPFFRISENKFDCLVAAQSIDQRQGTFHLASEQTLTISTPIPFLMKAKRVFVHTFSADEEFLTVQDVRLGKNSVFVDGHPIAAAHFSERLSPALNLGTLQQGQMFSVLVKNCGPSTIAFTAELEGQKIELP